MSYSFEYIDIILLAMIAGFIFLRLRGILGKKSGFEEDITQSFPHEFPNVNPVKKTNFDVFDDKAKTEFLSGAKIAYENIITDFSKGNLNGIKNLLEKNVFKQFEAAIKEREKQGNISETTFIGINSAEIKNHFLSLATATSLILLKSFVSGILPLSSTLNLQAKQVNQTY